MRRQLRCTASAPLPAVAAEPFAHIARSDACSCAGVRRGLGCWKRAHRCAHTTAPRRSEGLRSRLRVALQRRRICRKTLAHDKKLVHGSFTSGTKDVTTRKESVPPATRAVAVRSTADGANAPAARLVAVTFA